MIRLQRQALLLEIVAALVSVRPASRLLDGRQQQKLTRDANDGDHHQQLDQRKCARIIFMLNQFSKEKGCGIQLPKTRHAEKKPSRIPFNRIASLENSRTISNKSMDRKK